MSGIDAALLLATKWKKVGPDIRDEEFEQQDAFVMDLSRSIAAQTTRRAGKSTGLGIRFLRTMKTHPGCFCPYTALTRESAKNIMWPVLQELDERFKIGAHFTAHNLTMQTPGGSRLQLFGADMKNMIKRLKGIKTPGAGVDECQDFGDHLRALVEEVLEPATADYIDSWIALTGTPGPVPSGYFYEITDRAMHGYSLHKWTLYDNPYMPDPRAFVARLQKQKGWDDRHPTLLREYKNVWTLDPEALFIKYSEEKNHYDCDPVIALGGSVSYILGVDLGIRDSDALAVLAWSEESPEIYLVEEKTMPGQDITALAEQIEALDRKYHFSKIVCDEGALGKKIAEELRRRRHIPVHPADKTRKMENAAFLNDWLRLGRFKAKKDSRFATDSYLVQIDYEKSTPDRLVLKKAFHSDIIDAVLYAFKESPAFSYQEPPKKLAHGSKEWAEQETSEMERQAEEFFKNQEDPKNEWEW